MSCASPLHAKQAEIAASFKWLGTLFRVPPTQAPLDVFFEQLHAGKLADAWPFGDAQQLHAIQQKMQSVPRDRELDLSYQWLFIGPQHLEAPPWGSVYLDAEQVVFGESEMLLSQFLYEQGVTLDIRSNEPCDHIGLLCWLVAGFIEEEKDDALRILLAQHLLPWSGRYLELLQTQSQAPFYQGLAQLAQQSLATLAQETQVTPHPLPLYF